MEKLAEIVEKEAVYESYVEQLPEVMQEMIILGDSVDWEPYRWKTNPLSLLANVRSSLQELLEVIHHEKAKKSPD